MIKEDSFVVRPDMVAIDALLPFSRNARTHSKAQIRKLARSIKSLGIFVPVVVDEKNQILAGHARLDAARLMGLTKIPTIRFDHLSDEQKRAYVLADNKIAQDAGWDRGLLAIELKELSVSGFDLELTGFGTPEIDSILSDFSVHGEDDDDVNLSPAKGPAICKTGDFFALGKHKLICGDARLAETYQQLLGDERASFVITDPPYNVKIERNVSGLGKVRHQDFKMASGEMSAAEFTAFLQDAFEQLKHHSIAGSIHAVFMDWRHLTEMMAAGSKVYSELKNVCVWNKSVAGMGSFYRSKHELAFIWKNGTAAHINNFELGQHGRTRANVWEYPSANHSRTRGGSDLALHPTPKPVALIADAIKDCSRHGDIVLDAFAGSGALVIAAERTGRLARCIELDPKYCDVIIRRWQNFTGADAIEVSSNLTFDELANSMGKEATDDKR
jgi:DNA modification methylase